MRIQFELNIFFVYTFKRSAIFDSRHFRRCLQFAPYRFAYHLNKKTIVVRCEDSIVPVIAFRVVFQ